MVARMGLVGVVAITLVVGTPHPALGQAGPDTYVIVHGAWGGAWAWRKIDSLLTAAGHDVHRVQLTGLGSRAHLASPAIGLETHIADVVNAIKWEELTNVVLLGHSYGGMVITGVADRVPNHIQRLVYLDAFLPASGESLLDVAPDPVDLRNRMREDGFVYLNSMLQRDATESQSIPGDVPQPSKTFTDKLTLEQADRRIPATYILTALPTASSPDNFDWAATRASQRGWPVVRMEANHNPQVSAPAALLDILLGLR